MRSPAEGTMWCAVLAQALDDALRGKPGSLEQSAADGWLRQGPDLMTVAALAGLDGPTLRARYVAGHTVMPGRRAAAAA